MNSTIKFTIIGVVVCASCAAFADDEQVAVQSQESASCGRWTISGGHAWRSHATMGVKGTAYSKPLHTSNKTTTGDPRDSANWDLEVVKSPVASDPDPVWSTVNRTYVYSTKSGDSSVDLATSEEDSPHGFTLQAGFDFWRGETFSLGVGARFAKYKEMETSASGILRSSKVRQQVYEDHYYFLDDPCTGDPEMDLDPASDGSKPGAAPYSSKCDEDTGWQSVNDGRTVTTCLRTELRQFGFGPTFTWHACRWIDIGAKAEYLLCYARNHFEADGMGTSDTDHLNGFGCATQLSVNITERLSIFGRWGYEWIEKDKLELGNFKAEIDYTSGVMSAGIAVRF